MAVANAGLFPLLVLLSIAGMARGQPPKPSALFAFGDSYADTGNQVRGWSCWHYPYGITWPGHPTGRFGDGHIQTDYLANKLGLPSPTPYADVANQSITTGANFAVSGSGVTFALGALPLNGQVDNFELLLRNATYSPSFLADSVTLVSDAGNDFNPSYTNKELLVLIQEVLEGLSQALERMYNLGLRNIMVSNLPPINCLPASTIQSNYTTCNAGQAALIEFYNALLVQSVEKLKTLPNANFVILDELAAFTYVLNNTKLYGIKEQFAPCCRPLDASQACGNMDPQGNPLFTICVNPAEYVYWDTVHPVESTWNHVVDLFYSKPGYLIGDTTLESWLLRNSSRSSAPAPGPNFPKSGAVGQMEAAYQALLSKPEYAESLGLLQTANLDQYLADLPDQVVTIFIPNNDAFYSIPALTVDLIYIQAQVLSVMQFHVVKGYYDATVLSGSAQNLTTVSGLNLLVTQTSGDILIGPGNAEVVEPDLYKVEGQLMMQGINKLLIPPNPQ